MSRILSRRLVAGLDCLWAPFLLPSRAPLVLRKIAQTTPGASVRTYAIRTKRMRPLSDTTYYTSPDTDKSLLEFRSLVTSGEAERAMELYPSIIEKQTLHRRDTLAIAHMLHTQYRTSIWYRNAPDANKALLGNVQKIISDLKHGRLDPHPVAHVHIISYFKESKQFDLGEEYWSWLVQQDEGQLDARTYGSVIELMSYGGKTLPVLEDMYMEALKRFPGQFSEYHLSPGAIVMDPTQATAMAGTRMFLLQGIMTARVLHGDWRNAYLALDTALRLYPNQVPPRFFELVIYERPVSEAYRVFLIACRCERPPNCKAFTYLLESLTKVGASEKSSTGIPDAPSVMLNALHAYAGCGGRLDSSHINILASCVLSHLPPNPAICGRVPSLPEDDNTLIAVTGTLHNLQKLAERFGILPHISTYNTMMSVGGKKRRTDLIDLAWKEIKQRRLLPNVITYRTMIIAGGCLEDPDMVRKAWEDLKAKRATSRELSDRATPLELSDWTTFARAGQAAGMSSFVKKELNAASNTVDESSRIKVARELKNHTNLEKIRRLSIQPVLEEDELLRLLEKLNSKIEVIGKLVDSKKLLDFYRNPLPMALSDSLPPTHRTTRDLYNTLSRDPALVSGNEAASESTTKPLPTATTASGFPLDELRFQNWSAINDLLIEAEQIDKLREQAVDEAIATGKPVKRTKGGIQIPSALDGISASDRTVEDRDSPTTVDKPDVHTNKPSPMSIKDINTILRLRGQIAKVQ
ncbi:MAG: hypothetical protein M1812_002823 [Candelaria pacifica]|nr:MAG: hypothetical protein M1812_002823 [Candelaria pacifica]